MDNKKILEQALKDFETCQDANSHNTEAWIDDMRFARLGEQWPEEIKRQREIEGRPCLTINKLPSFIRQVTNDARQNTPAIKYHPVDGDASKETAEILDGLTKNIEYTSNADVAYDTALDHAVTGGFGFFRIVTDYADDDQFEQDIKIERIENPLTVYADPYDFGADSANWNVCFITDLLMKADFKKRWPKAGQSDFATDDKDKNPAWFSDDMVRVAEYWVRKEEPATLLKLTTGEVMFEPEYLKIKDLLDIQGITVESTRPTTTKRVTQYIISGAEVLEENKWPGKYIPIVPVYGDEVIVEGKRHFNSLIRFSKDSQRMFNYWRTTSTELVALAPRAPFIGARGSFNTDSAKWATANTVNHAYIEYDPVPNGAPPQRQPFSGVPAGALQEAINSADDMKSVMGIYDASLGARSNETSGRAILARQRESDTSTFNYIDNLSRAIRHAGRILCDLIPKVYSTARIIRVIGEDGTNRNVPINQQFQENPDEKSEKQEQDEAIIKLYDLTTGKYDVTCEAGPSFTTKREEAASQMIQFMQSVPNAGALIGDKLARNLDWPEADDIADRLKLMLPPQLQGKNPQAEQLQQQMNQMMQQAQQQTQQLQQQLQQLQQDKSMEAQKLQIDQFNAETNRMKAMKEGAPSPVQGVVQEVSEAEKMHFDAELQIKLKEMDKERAIEVELVKQRAALNTGDSLVSYDENLNPVATPIVEQLSQALMTLSEQMGKPK